MAAGAAGFDQRLGERLGGRQDDRGHANEFVAGFIRYPTRQPQVGMEDQNQHDADPEGDVAHQGIAKASTATMASTPTSMRLLPGSRSARGRPATGTPRAAAARRATNRRRISPAASRSRVATGSTRSCRRRRNARTQAQTRSGTRSRGRSRTPAALQPGREARWPAMRKAISGVALATRMIIRRSRMPGTGNYSPSIPLANQMDPTGRAQPRNGALPAAFA
jgi:hypothetical protein